MFALVVALAATILLTPPAGAETQYTVWSSVVLTRTGERTPAVLGDLPVQLTTLGAQQAYSAGAFYRNRYITLNKTVNDRVAPLAGLNRDVLSNLQVYASTLDYQWTTATAEAFVQGLYPPFSANAEDPVSNVASGEYITAPLGGYQYAQIHTEGGSDPSFLYLSANLDCPSWDLAAEQYTSTSEFTTTQQQFQAIYDAVGSGVLEGIVPSSEWNYANAYPIFDYLDYQNTHNTTFNQALANFTDVATNTSYLSILQHLADQQQYAQLGNLYAHNNNTRYSMPSGVQGSISTIAGNMLAAKVLAQLQSAIQYSGDEYFKLNLLFADYAPFVSFFALAQLPELDAYFYGLPSYGGSVAFELFSYADVSAVNGTNDFPSDTDDLWVRFYSRNGTDDSDIYQGYPLFGRDPEAMDMPWSDFQNAMYKLAVVDIGDWCLMCGASNIFCAAWNQSDASSELYSSGSAGQSSGSGRGKISPAVGGVIGAVVTLAVAALAFGAAMLFGGVRLHRVQRRIDLVGGFKGGMKMASDQDLTLPKGGAVASEQANVDPMSPVAGGHERVGSWELKQAKAGRENVADASSVRVPSFETERAIDPHMGAPVKPTESV